MVSLAKIALKKISQLIGLFAANKPSTNDI